MSTPSANDRRIAYIKDNPEMTPRQLAAYFKLSYEHTCYLIRKFGLVAKMRRPREAIFYPEKPLI